METFSVLSCGGLALTPQSCERRSKGVSLWREATRGLESPSARTAGRAHLVRPSTCHFRRMGSNELAVPEKALAHNLRRGGHRFELGKCGISGQELHAVVRADKQALRGDDRECVIDPLRDELGRLGRLVAKVEDAEHELFDGRIPATVERSRPG